MHRCFFFTSFVPSFLRSFFAPIVSTFQTIPDSPDSVDGEKKKKKKQVKDPAI